MSNIVEAFCVDYLWLDLNLKKIARKKHPRQEKTIFILLQENSNYFVGRLSGLISFPLCFAAMSAAGQKTSGISCFVGFPFSDILEDLMTFLMMKNHHNFHHHHHHSCVGHRWLNTKGPGRPLNSKPLCSGRVAGQTNPNHDADVVKC